MTLNFNLKTLATYAIAASLPTLAVAQTTTTPARPTTPPAMTSTPPANATQSSATLTEAARSMNSRRASKIIGANIYNGDNTDIGEVHDLMISANNPTIAVLSVGGFLGIGERYVAVPLSELQWNAERERWMMRGATVESLKARPAFSYPENS